MPTKNVNSSTVQLDDDMKFNFRNMKHNRIKFHFVSFYLNEHVYIGSIYINEVVERFFPLQRLQRINIHSLIFLTLNWKPNFFFFKSCINFSKLRCSLCAVYRIRKSVHICETEKLNWYTRSNCFSSFSPFLFPVSYFPLVHTLPSLITII